MNFGNNSSLRPATRIFSLLVLAILLADCTYSEKGSEITTKEPGTGEAPGTEGAPMVSAPEEFKTGSVAVLKSRDLGQVESYHCDPLKSGQVNSYAAFGCFIARGAHLAGKVATSTAAVALWPMASLIDEGITGTNSFADLLTHIGEPAPNVQTDILDASNPNALLTRLVTNPSSGYKNFPNLPFGTLPTTAYYSGLRYKPAPAALAEILRKTKNLGTTTAQIQQDLLKIDPALVELDNLIAVGMADPSFSFLIPKEFYQGKKEISIKPIDLHGIHALIGATRLSIKILNAYQIGIEPKRAVRNKVVGALTLGEILKSELVADMNGVGGDLILFAELKSGQNDQSALLPLLRSTVESIILVVDTLKPRVVHSDLFSGMFNSPENPTTRVINKTRKVAGYIKTSLDQPGVLYGVDPARPQIKLDISGALANLPNPKDVTSADPFILNAQGSLKVVPLFFKDLVKTYATY